MQHQVQSHYATDIRHRRGLGPVSEANWAWFEMGQRYRDSGGRYAVAEAAMTPENTSTLDVYSGACTSDGRSLVGVKRCIMLFNPYFPSLGAVV